MLSLSDVVRLPYTPDLTLAGIADTCRKRARAAYPSQPVILENLHASVASTASELAFRRYLDQQHVAYQLRKSPTPNNPDQRVLELAGNRCEWICPLISNHSDIQQLGEDANRLLALPVRLPRYTFIPSLAGDEDRMIFSFVIGLVTRTSRELEKTRTGQQPEYLIHFFPKPTFGGQYWTPLGQIELQANCRQPFGLECAGLN